MILSGPAWWEFLPHLAMRAFQDGQAETKGVASAPGSVEGRGALSRRLRHDRARLGATRCAAILRAGAAEAAKAGTAPAGRPFRLLLVAAQQPRSLQDALIVAFAIAGLAVTIREMEGLPALKDALDERAHAHFDGIDMALLVFARRGAARQDAGTLVPLAEALAGRSLAPVAIADLGGGADPGGDAVPGEAAGPAIEAQAPGVFRLCLALSPGEAFDERFASSFGSLLAAGAADRLGDMAAGLAARFAGTAPKLVVSDLDETLIDGILGEAASLPRIHAPYARALSVLSRRGLILGLATRNDPADIATVFDSPAAGTAGLALGDFADIAAGWDDKADLVGTLIGRLAIAPEHTVLIDDDPVNCAKAAARFPDMDVRHFHGGAVAFSAALLADPLLMAAGPAKGGEPDRRQAYRRKADVDRLRHAAPDISAFLDALETQVSVLALSPERLPRAAELASRVNQFVFNDWRPGVPALAARASPLDLLFGLDDAFGAHGIVGLVLASIAGKTAVIDNLALSCRALERRIDSAMLHVVTTLAMAHGAGTVAARVAHLARNVPALSCLSAHGFAETDGTWFYDLEANGPVPAPAGVAIQGLASESRRLPEGFRDVPRASEKG